jgi:flagellar protein FliT
MSKPNVYVETGLQKVPRVNYHGESGIEAIRQLQRDLASALAQEDWGRVKHLDRVCALVVERVVAANRDDRSILVRALGELKGVYSNLLTECRRHADQFCIGV